MLPYGPAVQNIRTHKSTARHPTMLLSNFMASAKCPVKICTHYLYSCIFTIRNSLCLTNQHISRTTSQLVPSCLKNLKQIQGCHSTSNLSATSDCSSPTRPILMGAQNSEAKLPVDKTFTRTPSSWINPLQIVGHLTHPKMPSKERINCLFSSRPGPRILKDYLIDRFSFFGCPVSKYMSK